MLRNVGYRSVRHIPIWVTTGIAAVAIRAALADGSLESARWQSYLRMQRATAHEVRRVDRPAAQQHRAQMKKLTKQLRRRVHEKSGEE